MSTRMRWAVLFLFSIVFFGCAWSDQQLKDASDKVSWVGQLFGPQGVVASGALTAAMFGVVKLYRAWKGDPVLTAMAASNAAAIQASKAGASQHDVEAILTAGIPGSKTAVTPEKVAEIVADAKVATKEDA